MTTQRYYPSKMAEMPEWNDNFIAKAPGYLTVLTNIVPAYMDACVASLKYMNYVLGVWMVAVRSLGTTATSSLDLLLYGSGPAPVPLPEFAPPALPSGVAGVPPGVLKRLFELVALIKASPGYNETIGLDLRIVGRPDTTEYPYPDFTIKLQQGAANQAVRLDFPKHGHAGVWIECRVNNGPWTFKAIDNLKPYVDEAPLAVPGQSETREYRMRWWDDGQPNGDWSPVQKITVGA